MIFLGLGGGMLMISLQHTKTQELNNSYIRAQQPNIDQLSNFPQFLPQENKIREYRQLGALISIFKAKQQKKVSSDLKTYIIQCDTVQFHLSHFQNAAVLFFNLLLWLSLRFDPFFHALAEQLRIFGSSGFFSLQIQAQIPL